LREVVEQHRAVLSTQILQEYFVVATRTPRVPADVARRKVEELAQLDLVLPRPELNPRSNRSAQAPSSFILGCACDPLRLGCRMFARALVSEDMQHGRTFDGVLSENPCLTGRQPG
jgi:predicted nucleic acid-binding protein